MSMLRPNPAAYLPVKPKRRWAKFTFIAIILLLVTGLLTVSGVVGWKLAHPAKRPIALTPDQFQLPYQDIQFSSRLDQTNLRGWLIPSGESKRIVIFAHGYRMNRSAEKPALPTAKALHDAGIATLLFDFRNSGESDGVMTSVGQFEKSDLLGAVDFAKSKGYEQIGLMGFSMGAATTLLTAPESPDVAAVVADSPFSDLRPYLEENLPVWSNLPSFPFTPLILWEIPLVAGVDLEQVRPIQTIRQLQQKPVLLIHTKGDDKIPVQHSEKLKASVDSAATELWVTSGTRHVGSFEELQGQYLEKVTQFFNAHLQ
ncbi:MAG: alpha/beta hydrolase [Clostridia bacterium]